MSIAATILRRSTLLLLAWQAVAALGQPAVPATPAPGTNASPAPAGLANFSIQINDGLGRPVPAVAVEVFRFVKQTNADDIKIVLGKATSENDGIARGVYDKGSIPSNSTFMVTLTKAGYGTVTAPPQINYTINKVFHSNDVATIAKLPYASQNEQVMELLAGEWDSPKITLADAIFAHDSELQPPLKRTVDDKNVGRQAAEMLAYIGNPDDVRFLLGDSFTPNGNPAVNRWADAVASALLAPTTTREWSFLKSCAMDEFGDHWVDLAGIRTLRLIASPQSLQMLKDVRDINTNRTRQIDSAIAYINQHPPPLADRDLAKAATKAAQALDSGAWLGNDKPRFNLKGDKALVDFNFIADGNRYLVYTGTFHRDARDANVWKLRGLRETKDAILPGSPSAQKPQASR